MFLIEKFYLKTIEGNVNAERFSLQRGHQELFYSFPRDIYFITLAFLFLAVAFQTS